MQRGVFPLITDATNAIDPSIALPLGRDPLSEKGLPSAVLSTRVRCAAFDEPLGPSGSAVRMPPPVPLMARLLLIVVLTIAPAVPKLARPPPP